MRVNIHLKVRLTVTPKNVKPLLGDTKSHFKFQPNVICSFGAILALSSDDDAADATMQTTTTVVAKAIPICLPTMLVTQKRESVFGCLYLMRG